MKDIVTNLNPAEWIRAMADLEHEPEPRSPYEDYTREKRAYASGGFGGPFDPPSGALNP